MKLKKSTLLGLILGVLTALAAHAQSPTADGQRPSAFQEEFHKTYPLTPGGHIELKNINGFVKISSWERNEVKVDALKYAGTRERLEQAHIVVEADPGAISIKTRYDDGHNLTFTDDDIVHNPATVDYTLTVPVSARLDAIKLINGNLDLQNLAGDVSASCINGRLRASALRGRTDLSTVNGTLDVSFAEVSSAQNPTGVIPSEGAGPSRGTPTPPALPALPKGISTRSLRVQQGCFRFRRRKTGSSKKNCTQQLNADG